MITIDFNPFGKANVIDYILRVGVTHMTRSDNSNALKLFKVVS